MVASWAWRESASQGRAGGRDTGGRVRGSQQQELSGTSKAGKSREVDRASGENGNNGVGRIPDGTGASR